MRKTWRHFLNKHLAITFKIRGTAIYTVSKKLCHRDLKTIQIYEKIIDKTKPEASIKIQLDI
jgi:hypothetical protein